MKDIPSNKLKQSKINLKLIIFKTNNFSKTLKQIKKILQLSISIPDIGNRSAVPMVPWYFLCNLFSLLKRGDVPSSLAGRLVGGGLYTEIEPQIKPITKYTFITLIFK